MQRVIKCGDIKLVSSIKSVIAGLSTLLNRLFNSLPHEAMSERYILRLCVCLSVCPSVRRPTHNRGFNDPCHFELTQSEITNSAAVVQVTLQCVCFCSFFVPKKNLWEWSVHIFIDRWFSHKSSKHWPKSGKSPNDLTSFLRPPPELG